jgi:hypothetical protein
MRTRTIASAISIVAGLGLSGCIGEIDDRYGSNIDGPTFEEYERGTYIEPWEDGVYIVDGDTPIDNIKKLREFYDSLFGVDGALIVHRNGNSDAKWSNSQKLDLTYCVSTGFGGRYSTVVSAMNQATDEWEQAADVDFIHVSNQDENCASSNQNVLFDVRPVNAQGQYLARAFFPGQSRSARNVLIDSSSFNSSWALTDVLAHELGHTLGFRHEHTRPESGACFEDDNWRPLTPYDSASIMHYPQCNGSSNALTMTNTDREGAASLYGAPNSGPAPDPDPGDRIDESGLSGNAGTELYFQMHVPAGAAEVSFVMSSGSGDADLHVRKGSQVSSANYDCRPYLNGNDEECTLNGAGMYYVMIRGYSSFSGVKLKGRFAEGDSDPHPADNIHETNLSGSAGTELFFQLDAPPSSTSISFAMFGGSGDADLYVKKGSHVSRTNYDCRPYATGNDETCAGDGPGMYYVMIRGYTNFSGVTLRSSN